MPTAAGGSPGPSTSAATVRPRPRGTELPLHKAVKKDLDVATFGKFLDDWAKEQPPRLFIPEDPDQHGYSPIHYFSSSLNWDTDKMGRDVQRMDKLLKYYKDTQNCLECDVVNLRAGSSGGDTPLHLALKFKRWVIGNRLLDYGADPTIRNTKSGWLPIHSAAFRIKGDYDHEQFRATLRRALDFKIHKGLEHLRDSSASQVVFVTPSGVEVEVPTPPQLAADYCTLDPLDVYREKGLSFEPVQDLFQRATSGMVARPREPPLSVEAVRKCFEFLLKWVVAKEDQETRLVALCIAAELKNSVLMETVLECGRPKVSFWPSSSSSSSKKGVALERAPLHILAKHEATHSALDCVELLLSVKYHGGSTEQLLTFITETRVDMGVGVGMDKKSALDLCCELRNVGVAAIILLVVAKEAAPFADLSRFSQEAAAAAACTQTPVKIVRTEPLSEVFRCVPKAILPVLKLAYSQLVEHGEKAVDFSGIYPSDEKGSCCLHKIALHPEHEGQEDVLLHPFTERFLKTRWTRTEKGLVALAVLFQSLLLIVYVIAVCTYALAITDPPTPTPTTSPPQNETAWTTPTPSPLPQPAPSGWDSAGFAFAWAALGLAVLDLIMEAVQFSHAGFSLYIGDLYNLAQLAFSFFAIFSVSYALGSFSVECTKFWQLSVIGILLACLVFMMQLRNVPGVGYYISIIWLVTCKSVKIIGVFVPFFIAFSLVFRIIASQSIFRSLDWASLPVKVLSMMIGELTFNEIMVDMQNTTASAATGADGIWRHYTSLVMFTLFAFLGTIVLLNLLVGMAVDVTEEMERKAQTKEALCKLESIHYVEMLAPMFKDPKLWFSDTVSKMGSMLNSCTRAVSSAMRLRSGGFELHDGGEGSRAAGAAPRESVELTSLRSRPPSPSPSRQSTTASVASEFYSTTTQL